MPNDSKEHRTINISKIEGIATITLQNPPFNILTIQMMNELIVALETINTDGATNVILIRGDGKCFSAGADVREHLPATAQEMILTLDNLCSTLLNINIPTVCATHGMALGGGFELATLCDITLASSECRLGLPEIKLGVFPPIAAALYPKWIGYKASLAILLTGREITPYEALRMGLVNEVFQEENFESEVEIYVRDISLLSRSSLTICKKAIKIGLNSSNRTLEEINKKYLDELMPTSDAKEGLAAFLEKRKPQWKNC